MEVEKCKLFGSPEETVTVMKEEVKGLKEKTSVLEERFGLLSKFTIKVNHATATTLQLLQGN